MASLRACRSVDAAAAQLIVRESGGLVAFRRRRDPLAMALADLGGAAPRSPRRGRPRAWRRCAGAARDVICWELAERVAAGLGGEAATARLPGDLAALARAAEQAVLAYTALAPAAPLPRAEVVGRDDWSRANVRLLRATLGPLERAPGRRRAAPGRCAPSRAACWARQIGGLVGYLSRRVLGPVRGRAVARAAARPAAPLSRRAEPARARRAIERRSRTCSPGSRSTS